MASPADIQKLLRELEISYRKLAETNPFQGFDASIFSSATDAVNHLQSALNDVNNRLNTVLGDVSDITNAFRATVDEIKKGKTSLTQYTSILTGMERLTRQLQQDQDGINRLGSKELKDLKTKLDLRKLELKNNKDSIQIRLDEISKMSVIDSKTQKERRNLDIALATTNDFLKEGDSIYKDINDKLEHRLKIEERITDVMGLSGALIDGMDKTLKGMGMSRLSNWFGIDEAKEAMEETARSIQSAGSDTDAVMNKSKVLGAGFSKMKENILKNIKDPMVLVGFIVHGMIEALYKSDQQTGQLAKSFGTSYSEAASLRNELNTIANLSGDVNITTGALQESLIAVNKEFGTATMFSGELLKDFTNMTKVMGYTDEAAAKLSKITVATGTGTDLSDNTAQILGTAAAFNVTNDLALNEKEIVEGVAKASASVTVSLGMQPKAIAKSVLEAKKLGLELEQVEGIAESLLNFESSISNELEAELLTGRSLNLEQARYLALTNDIGGVAKEIANQGITSAEFSKMNTIQQKALAEAVGLTKEELAQSLINQQALTKLGGKDKDLQSAYNRLKKEGLSDDQIAKKLGDDKLAQQMKSQSIQERFNATVEKLQEIFVSIAEPILQIVSPFMDLATTILPLVNIALFPITNGVKVVGEGISYVLNSVKALTGALTGSNKELSTMQAIIGGIAAAYLAYQGVIIATNIYQGISAALSTEKALAENASLVAIYSQRVAEAAGLGIKAASAVLSGTKAIAEVTAAEAISFGLATLAIIGGVAAVISSVNNKKIKDGIIDPNKGVVVSGGFGSVQLDEKDTFIGDKNGIKAGTNLFGNTAQPTSPSISINMAPLVNEMQAVKAVLVQILNKDSNVYMDGAKVGKGISMASSKIG